METGDNRAAHTHHTPHTSHIPLNLCEQEVNVMATLLSALKYSLTFVKEQDGVVNFGFSENKLKVFSSTHAAQGRKIDQQHLNNNINQQIETAVY